MRTVRESKRERGEEKKGKQRNEVESERDDDERYDTKRERVIRA